MVEPEGIESVMAELDAPGWYARRQAVERLATLLRRGRPPGGANEVAQALFRLARDEAWEVREAVATAAQFLYHRDFDPIVALLQGDPHRYVRRAAVTSLQRRRLAVSTTGRELDELADVEARIQALAAEHSPELAAAVRDLALAYSSALVGGADHDARIFTGVLARSLDKLRGTLTERGVPQDEWAEPLQDAERRSRMIYASIKNMGLFTSHATSAPERVVLLGLAEKTVKDLREHLGPRVPRDVQVSLLISPDLELDAPRDLLQLALGNVVKNALEAVDEAGYVGLDASAGDGSLTLVVNDDGPGIPPEIIDEVFQPFFSTKKGLPGADNTGWGLTLARRIVEHDCRGRLTLESDPAVGGTSVFFHLPLAREDDA